jgi:ceramide glucosyltransferase
MLHTSPGILLVLAVAAVAIAALVLLLVSDRAVRRLLARKSPGREGRPFISVMKPMKGNDDELYENLVAFATQDYPAYELMFGVADWEDPAYAVARRVKREYPECAISIHVCRGSGALNPKVSILSELSRRARSDLILISDSNVRPEPDYLEQMSRELADPEVGLVTHLIAGVDERTLGAAFAPSRWRARCSTAPAS